MTLSEKAPPKVFGMGPPKSLIRPCLRLLYYIFFIRLVASLLDAPEI